MSITNDDNYVCDFCRGMSGEFNAITGNHVSCEETENLEKVNRSLQSQLEDVVKENQRLEKLMKAKTQSYDTLSENRDICYECFDILDDESKEIRENVVREENKRMRTTLKRLKEDGDRLLVNVIYDNDTQMEGAKCAYCYADGVFNREILKYEFLHDDDCPITLHTQLMQELSDEPK